MTKVFAVAGLVAVVLLGGASTWAQEVPKPPAPEKEHEWLKQLAGEWESEAEVILEPGKPAVKCKGTESARVLGGFWLIGEQKNELLGIPVTGVMTVGYDSEKKKFVGTWVCSVDAHLWKYEGTVDSAGKVLTLETEGPNPMAPGKMAKMRDAVEIKSPDHKVLTASILGEDGKWTTFMTMNSRRKK